MRFTFLSAHWRHLCLITYSVPAALMEPYLPPGTTLDTRDGQTFASLVAFDFAETRVLGVPWPGYRRFAEWNLRIYVRNGDDRGVVFVREFVPKRLIAWIARGTYNEPYRAAPVRQVLHRNASTIGATYLLGWGGRTHTISVTGTLPPTVPPETSTDHFFKEHQWGFGRTYTGKPQRYEVVHPLWDVFPVQQYTVDVDWAALYGPEWAVMQNAEPYAVTFARGSPVRIYPKSLLPW